MCERAREREREWEWERERVAEPVAVPSLLQRMQECLPAAGQQPACTLQALLNEPSASGELVEDEDLPCREWLFETVHAAHRRQTRPLDSYFRFRAGGASRPWLVHGTGVSVSPSC